MNTDLIISQTVINDPENPLARRVITVYVDKVEMTGNHPNGAKTHPLILDGKRLADLRDDMAVIVDNVHIKKGWVKDEEESTDNLPNIESELSAQAKIWNGTYLGTDSDFIADISFRNIREAYDFIEAYRMELETVFRPKDGIDPYYPFAKGVVVQIPIHLWWRERQEEN